MAITMAPLTITYRHPGTQPPIFLAGEFSDPLWEPQEMDHTADEEGEHTFRKEIMAAAGSKVQYKFRVGLGDWWVLDETAPTAVDAGGFLNNVAEVPTTAEPSTPPAVAEETEQVATGGAGSAEDQNQKNGGTKSTKEGGSQAQGTASAKDLQHQLDLHSESGTDPPDFVKTTAEVADSAALLDKEDDEKGQTVANAAKELMNRADTHSGSGASTPDYVKTSAEVADSAALLDKEDEQERPTVANAAKELINRLDTHSGSGTSTPSFVKTAAEVADSAALLDKEDAELEVPDEEAGRTGFRRMSLTPIQDVAATAAEVADTAEGLDSESIPQFEVRPADYDSTDPYGFDEPSVSESKAPLFAHECVGMELYEGDDPLDPLDDEHHGAEYEEDRRPSTVYDADEDIDLNDPTLEKFPSIREEIIDTVRKLEGGLNEDHSDVEGLIPLSPVVGPSGPQNHDLVGDFLVSSPAVASPVMQRGSGSGSGSGSRLLGLPRASMGSISSDRSSALSLGSISEAEEAADEYEAHEPPILSTPRPRQHPFIDDDAKSPTSDDDEGIVMKAGSEKNGKSAEISSNDDTPVRTPAGDRTPKTPISGAQTEDDSHGPSRVKPEIKLVPASEAGVPQQASEPSARKNGETSSPRVVAQPEESTGAETEENLTQEETATDRSAPDSPSSSTTRPTGSDTGAQSTLRRRVAPPDRVATPSSINEAGIQAAKSGNWFKSFFRMLFVDWIGGFISRLCGGNHETLFAAGAVGILVGVAWWSTAT